MKKHIVKITWFKTSTGQGVVFIPGQKFELPQEKAYQLIKSGRIIPFSPPVVPEGGPAPEITLPMACIKEERFKETQTHPDKSRPHMDGDGDPFNSDSDYNESGGGLSTNGTLKELFEEQSTIQEYEGGQTRQEAVIGAREDSLPISPANKG